MPRLRRWRDDLCSVVKLSRTSRLVLWAVAAVLLGLGVSRVTVDGDVGRFISAAAPNPQLELGLALQRGPAGQLVIVSIEAPTSTEAARASRTLVEALRKSGHFSSIHNGEYGSLAEEFAPLIPYRYVLSDRLTSSTFSESNLKRSLQEAEAMLGDARAWLVERLLPIDPTLETLHLAQQWSGAGNVPLVHGVWFTRDLRRGLILGVTRASGSDAAGQQAAASAIDDAAAALRTASSGGSLRVQATGLGLLSAKARQLTRSRVELLGWISGTLVFVILYLGYRRFLPVALSLVPAALGIAAGLAATSWWFGDVNILAVAFACILIDEGSDYPSYLLTQARRGWTVDAEALRVWPTLRLAMLTSVAAFAVLLFAQFQGLQQLGLLCSVGLLVAGISARWLLPALLGRRYEATWEPPRLARFPALAQASDVPSWWKRLRPGLILAPVLAALTLALSPALWDDGVASINPLPADVIAADRELRGLAGLPQDQSVLLLRGESSEEILQAEETLLPFLLDLRKQGRLEGFDLAARYLPSLTTQQLRQAAIPDAGTLQSRLQRAVVDTGFNDTAFDPFLEQAERARTQALDHRQIPAGLFRTRVEGLLIPAGDGWAGLVPIQGEIPRNELLRLAGEQLSGRAVSVEWFEPRTELSALLKAVRERLAWLLLACFAVVAVVVAVALRSARRAANVMRPVFVTLLLTAALAHALFGSLSVFHLVALMLVLGLMTNYSVFLAVPQPATAMEPSLTTFSLLIASATTLAVFGALALSGIRVVTAVGQTVVVGIIVGLAWLALARESAPRR